MSNVFAVIPARGGSKRIPDKNIALVGGKPLISLTIDNLLNSRCFESVIVSTDSERIRGVSLDSGALCPFLRPKHLSDDFTPTVDVIRHALRELDFILNEDVIMCIYSTAVLLTPDVLKTAINNYLESNLGSAFMISISRYSHPIERALKLNSDSKIQFMKQQYLASRTQDFQDSFFDAGQFYIASKESWLDSKDIFNNAHGFIIPQDSFIDIDYPQDLARLHKLLGSY